ncbi:unnamed protein product [Closterium sp. NIES-65]|nr:unnamed protein product [Closterium sp. NIES-65]
MRAAEPPVRVAGPQVRVAGPAVEGGVAAAEGGGAAAEVGWAAGEGSGAAAEGGRAAAESGGAAVVEGVRMIAMLSTSPRAQRAARRGEASRLQEQQREEQAGQEGVAALEAPADGEADAGAGETSSREDAAAKEPGLTVGAETVVALTADSMEVERVERWPAAETAAASDGGLVSPVVARPAATMSPADKDLAAEEVQGEQWLPDPPTPAVADSPPTLEETEIAVVVAEAARQQGQPPSEAGAPIAAVSAGMPAAAAAANTQEHGQAERGIEGPAIAVASGAAPARRKTKLRTQPAPRRPRAGLGPGAPGPLLGWLRQGQSPPEQAHSLPSAPQPAVGPSMGSNMGEVGQA